ncbi:virulence factor family protein [Verticiella sediminum]|uniref:Virulence factor family protein n=1 Tax=Verticiella sediminum TaxID=1247510 RepID=A0A556ABK1_9BURK|nr:AcvB/VirJ family lysyl-phosphatidylglycerol hydrolase [Verticiella sediminum]TSH90272.1 virulence factor family protein [Verticiella sediminum]
MTCTRLLAWACSAALALAGAVAHAAEPVRFSHGLFENIPVYPPQGDATGAVMLISDAEGWDAAADALARALAGAGALVAGVDVRTLYRDARAVDCLYPYGDLDNLARNVQAYLQARTVYAPIVAGLGEGGALAYAVSAGAPAGTFVGALSYGFRPRLNAPLLLCEGRDEVYTTGARREPMRLLPVGADAPPWYDLQNPTEPDASAARAFLAHVPQGHALAYPDDAEARHLGPLAPAVQARWVEGYRALAAHAQRTAGAPAALAELPLVPVEAKAGAPASDLFAVLVSGDGGWAKIDEVLAEHLTAAGVPVVGVDALRYFWRERTPEGWARDLERIVAFYRAQWHKPRVVLIGFSQGADVMPFAASRLSPGARAAVARVVLLSPGQRAAFEFHVANWLSSPNDGVPVAPEIQRLPAGLVVCVYGEDDDGSVCPGMKATPGVEVRALPGDHHFDDDYDAVGRVIRDAYAVSIPVAAPASAPATTPTPASAEALTPAPASGETATP